jgi:hypothetical protein
MGVSPPAPPRTPDRRPTAAAPRRRSRCCCRCQITFRSSSAARRGTASSSLCSPPSTRTAGSPSPPSSSTCGRSRRHRLGYHLASPHPPHLISPHSRLNVIAAGHRLRPAVGSTWGPAPGDRPPRRDWSAGRIRHGGAWAGRPHRDLPQPALRQPQLDRDRARPRLVQVRKRATAPAAHGWLPVSTKGGSSAGRQ